MFHLGLGEVSARYILINKYVLLCFYSKALFDRASSRLKSLWRRQARPRVQMWKGGGVVRVDDVVSTSVPDMPGLSPSYFE